MAILPGTGPFRFYRVAEKLVDFMPAAFFTLDGTVVSATDYHVTKRAGVTDLQPEKLAFIADAAIARWVAVGVDDASLNSLRELDLLSIEDLARSQLHINGQVDVDAAGWGWYVDPTPLLDEEYEFDTGHAYRATDPLAANRYDLLSVLIQHFGRELGIEAESDKDDVMGTTLSRGVRRLPDATVVDRLLGDSN